MHNIELTIKTDERGLREVVIRSAQEDRVAGVHLLERLLPALAESERMPKASGPEGARR